MMGQHIAAYVNRLVVDAAVSLRLNEACRHYREGLLLMEHGQLRNAHGESLLGEACAELYEAKGILLAFLNVWEDRLLPEQVTFLDEALREADRALAEAKQKRDLARTSVAEKR